MQAATPIDRFAVITAPADWQAVDFISDLHLQAGEPETLEALASYLKSPTTQRGNALFILGDLFEVWIGDDVLTTEASDAADAVFWRTCASALRAFSKHTPVFFLHGNRDFLLGPAALAACGMQGLSDPTVLVFQGRRWLLSHGDELCLADTDYMRFRAQVRTPEWQQAFLAQPLATREGIARDMRTQSEARKRSTGHDQSLWADVDTHAARAWLRRADAQTLIHGHTHRPATHALGGGGLQRVVLSDWDLCATPPRAELLRLDGQGLQRLPLTP
ncbi:UDP-2,3-diacylglucosamine diphosphatase [Hydrogenophaga sp.]|uniref:UDP-2,3-diacylglucosamine diphosphatase n=1 Tax=Hydrogenophaga sp. TaxID=1904254 RepID=UPI00271A4190|nr:UDP-2,3-diacylglucosamine diphosphatase [Hydrogenophaga sp.]MDO9434356.1 UDP-2,3-diacylglucosamine diphosphatase [Hydrogenophaga sp.]